MDALPPLPAPLLDNLKACYAEPHRHYHTLDHVEAVLAHLEAHRALARQPDHLVAAAWYHDVVYDPRMRDNEVCSADIARFQLMSVGWLGIDVERVAMMVEATKHHRPSPDDPDTQLFLDLDLAVLGTPAPAYDGYVAAVRREYAFADDAAWRAGRSAVLRAFLARPVLYGTPALQAAWEAPARANLARELATLS